MKFVDYKPEWLDILRRQEEMLRFESFTAEDALALGLIMARLAKEKYKKSAAFRIIVGGHIAFSYLMDGTTSNNDWWMDKKLNTCRITGVSSILSLVEVAEGARAMEPEFEIEDDFALCGGCFPIRNRAGKLLGYTLCSGMPHWMDHQLMMDALCEYLRVDAPAIEG
ncbi:MAG: heme-binding protein [Clostridia bacterium]|nr:heme-binding protein [Clostridia bacterium]